MVKRAGFTLIELIFAIVIISVVVMSLPKMSQLLTKNMDTNLVQEAVFAAATEIQEATTYHWDDNSLNDENASRAGVINLDNTCEDNTSSTRYRLRPGHILQPYHRVCIEDLTKGATNTNSNTHIFSVSDINQSSHQIFTDNITSQEGYKYTYTSQIDIDNSPSFANTTHQNLKKITVTIKDSEGNILTSLSSYVANIGEVDYYKRSY